MSLEIQVHFTFREHTYGQIKSVVFYDNENVVIIRLGGRPYFRLYTSPYKLKIISVINLFCKIYFKIIIHDIFLIRL